MTAAAVALALQSSVFLWLAAFLTAFTGVRQFRHSGLLQGLSCVHRIVLQTGALQIVLGDGRQVAATVSAESRVYAGMVLLKLRTRATTLNPPVVILHDRLGPVNANTDSAEFRRLRVWLRLGQHQKPDDAIGPPSRFNHGESRNG